MVGWSSTELSSGIEAKAARGAITSGLNQGIGALTGLQDSFSWAGVAAAGVGAAAGTAVGQMVHADPSAANSIGNHARNLGVSTASLLANAATRSAIEGSSFARNVTAALPDVIAQAVFDAVSQGVSIPKKQIEADPVAQGGDGSRGGNNLSGALHYDPRSTVLPPDPRLDALTRVDLPPDVQLAVDQMQAERRQALKTKAILEENARLGGPYGHVGPGASEPYQTDEGRTAFTDAGWSLFPFEMRRRWSDFHAWKASLGTDISPELQHDIDLRYRGLVKDQEYTDYLDKYSEKVVLDMGKDWVRANVVGLSVMAGGIGTVATGVDMGWSAADGDLNGGDVATTLLLSRLHLGAAGKYKNVERLEQFDLNTGRLSNSLETPTLSGFEDLTGTVTTRIGGAAEGLPNVLRGADRAIIDPRKLTEYALNPAHPVGGNKARVFESAFGFNAKNADDLLAQLSRGVRENPAIPGKVDQYGSRFTVDIPVTGPTGSGTVRTGWIYKVGSEVPELTTLFPK